MAAKLTDLERTAALMPLRTAGWTEVADRDAITKDFVFADFVTAFSWMSAIALEAEKRDHHPEWSNVYKTVTVTLTTHDAGGLTALDIGLATEMERHAANSAA
ncbi:MAG: 4a-hydroxytetrahydrobiopterin dehydratase [Pseudomonadota bacterium]